MSNKIENWEDIILKKDDKKEKSPEDIILNPNGDLDPDDWSRIYDEIFNPPKNNDNLPGIKIGDNTSISFNIRDLNDGDETTKPKSAAEIGLHFSF